MTLKNNLKAQLNTISSKVTQAEKVAAKQIQNIVKRTETLRTQQLKNVQGLVKKAKGLQNTKLVQRAEELGRNIETRASEGLDLVLAKLNLSTKKDVERLSRRVSQLQKRLDEIEKSTSKQ